MRALREKVAPRSASDEGREEEKREEKKEQERKKVEQTRDVMGVEQLVGATTSDKE